jgi:hypothetical protein
MCHTENKDTKSSVFYGLEKKRRKRYQNYKGMEGRRRRTKIRK